jgi:general secretion pathway protein H
MKLTRPAGFTLLEIMVVMVLIGIIASFAVVQIPSNDPSERVYTQARRLVAVLRQQWETAILLGQQRGLHFQASGYRVLLLNPNSKKWQVPTDPNGRVHYELNEAIDLQLSIEGRPVAVASNAASDDNALPQIMFLSSGEATEFQLVISQQATSDTAARTAYRLQGSVSGQFDMAVFKP